MADDNTPLLDGEANKPRRTAGQRIGSFVGGTLFTAALGAGIGAATGLGTQYFREGAQPTPETPPQGGVAEAAGGGISSAAAGILGGAAAAAVPPAAEFVIPASSIDTSIFTLGPNGEVFDPSNSQVGTYDPVTDNITFKTSAAAPEVTPPAETPAPAAQAAKNPNLVERAWDSKRMPDHMKWGAGIGAGLGAVGSMLRKNEPVGEHTARILKEREARGLPNNDLSA